MARARSPNRDKAKQMWLDSGGEMKLKDIAAEFDVLETQIRKWKSLDNWESELKSNVPNDKGNVPKRNLGGAPLGNKNALGNEGGAPKGNANAVTHGFFRKFFPNDALEIMEHAVERSPLDMLWDQITIQYTAIIRAQQIMYVRDRDDKTMVLTKSSNNAEEWEYQFAWDKQATFLQAQSRAMSTLQSLIKQYEELCRQGYADEEQQLRITKLNAEVALLERKANKDDDQPIEIVIKRKGERS